MLQGGPVAVAQGGPVEDTVYGYAMIINRADNTLSVLSSDIKHIDSVSRHTQQILYTYVQAAHSALQTFAPILR